MTICNTIYGIYNQREYETTMRARTKYIFINLTKVHGNTTVLLL